MPVWPASAARRLADAGVAVTVVEARNRIGGRTWTDTSLGIPIDLGAAWFHGTEGNPLVGLADEVGAKTVKTDFENVVVLADGVSGWPPPTSTRPWATGRESWTRSTTRPRDAGPDETVADAWAPRVDLDDPLVQWCVASTISAEYAADPDELALRWFGSEGQLDGPDVILPGGYGQLVNQLAQGLTVKLGHAVTRIEHDDSGVRVRTSQAVMSGRPGDRHRSSRGAQGGHHRVRPTVAGAQAPGDRATRGSGCSTRSCSGSMNRFGRQIAIWSASWVAISRCRIW